MDRFVEEGGAAEGRLSEFGNRLKLAVGRLLSANFRCGDLDVYLLVNPVAGRIADFKRREKFIVDFEAEAAVLGSQMRAAAPRIHFAESPAPGGLKIVVREALRSGDEQSAGGKTDGAGYLSGSDRRKFFISFGGDGTHQEVLDALITNHNPSDQVLFTRVGLGTGNDGVDIQTATDLAQVLATLDTNRPLPFTAVRVTTARGARSYSGNIAGVGLDAYVVFLSEDYKKKLPGAAYKIAADIGVLFYKRTFKLKEARVTVERGGESSSFSLLPGILSFGASGFRCYGQGMPVLPGPENFCIIPVGNVFQNIALKGQLYHGTHVESPRVRMEDADRATIEYSGRLPMQLDGEAQWLEPEDFPVCFERIQVGSWLIQNRSSDAAELYRRTLRQGSAAGAPQNYPGSA